MDSTDDTMDSCTDTKKRRMEESTPSKKDATTNQISFDTLNSTQLTKIFSMVELKELAALGSTCKKFNRIARKVFAAKHQSQLIEIYGNGPLVKVATILRCFQNQFTRLAIFYANKPKVNVKIDVLINKYCRQMLNELQLSDVGLYSSARSFIFPFRNVMQLIIRSGLLSGKLDDIATSFPNVMSIVLHAGVQPGGEKDNTAIPTLQHLSISFDPNVELDAFKTTLMTSNPQLTSLIIDYSDDAPIGHLLLIRDSLPNLQRLTLRVKTVFVDKEPFKPLLFKNLRFLTISYTVSNVLRNFVITSTFPFELLDLSIEGGIIDGHCVEFLKRHQAKHLQLTLSKVNNQQIEKLIPVLSSVSHVNFVIHKEFSVTRSGLMHFVSQCKNLEYVRIQQPNMLSLPPIVITCIGINESLWNKD
ncbi:uncharacterized protein LOC116348855 [Contarinia nasturtii]|uniref:uncharacterized protein LOC116348855 n=1 Tax=Contarinia nasturtii TaxID=265458 RepID=UPI0012D45B56|nr:uncharacterized protein LOC116348855 [Contarinia nasturtii]XP_031635888.1 uncharacterized protein LOC116348855 [Contarinia nasturtii]